MFVFYANSTTLYRITYINLDGQYYIIKQAACSMKMSQKMTVPKMLHFLCSSDFIRESSDTCTETFFNKHHLIDSFNKITNKNRCLMRMIIIYSIKYSNFRLSQDWFSTQRQVPTNLPLKEIAAVAPMAPKNGVYGGLSGSVAIVNV